MNRKQRRARDKQIKKSKEKKDKGKVLVKPKKPLPRALRQKTKSTLPSPATVPMSFGPEGSAAASSKESPKRKVKETQSQPVVIKKEGVAKAAFALPKAAVKETSMLEDSPSFSPVMEGEEPKESGAASSREPLPSPKRKGLSKKGHSREEASTGRRI